MGRWNFRSWRLALRLREGVPFLTSWVVVFLSACHSFGEWSHLQEPKPKTLAARTESPARKQAPAVAKAALPKPEVSPLDEGVAQRIDLRGRRSFEIDRHEVTAGQYAECVKKKRCSPARRGGRCTFDSLDLIDHPINCVSYRQAADFCTFKKKRLPTAAEWDAAAFDVVGGRAGAAEQKKWPPPENAANIADESARRKSSHWNSVSGYQDGYVATAPVGSFAPNEYGLFDLVGNVAEWTAGRSRARKLRTKKAVRGVRGGSFGSYRAPRLSAAGQDFYLVSHVSAHVGFRCARSVK